MASKETLLEKQTRPPKVSDGSLYSVLLKLIELEKKGKTKVRANG